MFENSKSVLRSRLMVPLLKFLFNRKTTIKCPICSRRMELIYNAPFSFGYVLQNVFSSRPWNVTSRVYFWPRNKKEGETHTIEHTVHGFIRNVNVRFLRWIIAYKNDFFSTKRETHPIQYMTRVHTMVSFLKWLNTSTKCKYGEVKISKLLMNYE